MVHRPLMAPGGRREGPDVLEAEERGVVVGGLRQRQQRAEEADGHERARP